MERECRCAEEVMRYVIHGKTTVVAGAMRCKNLMMPHRAVPATLQMQPHVGTENLVAPGQTRRRRLPRHRSVYGAR